MSFPKERCPVYRNMKAKTRNEKRVDRTILKFKDYVRKNYLLDDVDSNEEKMFVYERIMRAKRRGFDNTRSRGQVRAKEKRDAKRNILEEGIILKS